MAEIQQDHSELRLVRVLLRTQLLRDVDQIVLSGRGDYESRQEFFTEAIQNHVLEVLHGMAESGQLLLSRGVVEETPRPIRSQGKVLENRRAKADDQAETLVAVLPPALANGQPIVPIEDMSDTALPRVARGFALRDGIAVFKQEPLFGLHNRDFPSLWALNLLAQMASDGPVPAQDAYGRITQEAWRLAKALETLEETTSSKITALYPTNLAKPQSAEDGFRAFALGSINRKADANGMYGTAGPLYGWQAAQLVNSDGGPSVGLTEAGWDLVEAMVGLTLQFPRSREFADRFFAYLRDQAPWDLAGFEHLLAFVEQRPTRTELTAKFGQWQPTWSDAVQNTNAAGFVARAREWGLVEPKLVDGRYILTEYGESMLSERSAA
jgi:hypothetical protein